MTNLRKGRKKEITRRRLRFIYQEVVWGFLIALVFLLVPFFLIPLIVGEGSYLYGISFYTLRAILVFAAIPLVFPFSNLIFESQKRNIILEEDISPSIGHLRLYKMKKNNFKYQILYGLLIFFLVFLPIDFFTYFLIPEMLDFQANALASKTTDLYLRENNYFLFLVVVIIIQFSVALTEETVSRGLLTKRGSEHFFKISAVIISALYWGLGHFAFFLDPISRTYSVWIPFLWFLQAFFIGIILSLLVLRRKWLFPAIIAHALNNFISAHAVWNFLQGNDFMAVALYLYYPLLIVGCMLFVWYYSQIKEGISIGLSMLKSYFTRDNAIEETKGDTVFRIFIDILMGILIFILGFIIMI